MHFPPLARLRHRALDSYPHFADPTNKYVDCGISRMTGAKGICPIFRTIGLTALISTVLVGTGNCQERLTVGHDSHVFHAIFSTSPTPRASQEDFVRVELTSHVTDMFDAWKFASPYKGLSLSEQPIRTDFDRPVIILFREVGVVV